MKVPCRATCWVALSAVDTVLRQRSAWVMTKLVQARERQQRLESGRINEAVAAYEKSVALLADSALLRVAYAHALLEQKDPKKLDLAIHQLTEANRLESRNPQTWRFLAAARSTSRP